MEEKDRKADEFLRNLEGVEVTELDDESLEDVAGGNTNCGNTQCCLEPNNNLGTTT